MNINFFHYDEGFKKGFVFFNLKKDDSIFDKIKVSFSLVDNEIEVGNIEYTQQITDPVDLSKEEMEFVKSKIKEIIDKPSYKDYPSVRYSDGSTDVSLIVPKSKEG